MGKLILETVTLEISLAVSTK